MYYFLLYFFIIIAVLSSIVTVLFDRRRLSALTIFMLSVSGIFVLINAGYIAYLLIFSSLIYYTIKKIIPAKELIDNKNNGNNYFTYITISSIFGAIIASVTGSAMWQGKVVLNSEITLSNLFVITGFEYFIFFLLIFSALPVIIPLIRPKGEY